MDPKTEEFINLSRMAGWSQAEVARRLHITPGAVSQLFSGRTRPRAATLNLLKMIVAKEMPEVLAAHESTRSGSLAGWESQLLEELRRLPTADRDRVLTGFHQMIKTVEAATRRRAV